MSDDELERLKARRLAEMQRNISSQGAPGAAGASEAPAEPAAPDPRRLFAGILGFRGLEVLEAAEAQFPRETAEIVSRLAPMIRSGELRSLDGGRLLALFRTVGLAVRMRTSIKVEQDGRMVSLGERIRGGADDP